MRDGAAPLIELSLKQTLVAGGHYVAPEPVLRYPYPLNLEP